MHFLAGDDFFICKLLAQLWSCCEKVFGLKHWPKLELIVMMVVVDGMMARTVTWVYTQSGTS